MGTNTDSAQYVIFSQPRGADKSWSGEVDSKVGVQGTFKANAMFSGTVQLLSKQNGDGNFTPGVEWAFAKAQLMPALALRVGRMGGPFFAVSDFRDVGYANTWLRPPQDVYGQVPVSHFDGADVILQTSIGSATLSTQLFGGQSKAVVQSTDVDLKKLVGFNATLDMDGGISLRVGHLQGKLTVHNAALNGLVATMRSVPVPGWSAVADQLDPNNKKATFSGIGASVDEGNWIANFEYTMRRTDTYVPDTDGWYVTLGHRFGKFTPYATVSQLKQKSGNVDNNAPAPTPQLAGLKGAVAATLSGQTRNQKTMAVGLRWDAYRNLAVKGQFERIKPNGNGLFVQTQPGFGTGASVNVYSLAVDMVF
ncbi:hypothetical protein [Paucibacter soli]|uniref:hypothetical protein n=1 Tax=Paucibacter soli TaxID=3133433 RepID=UPI0030AF14EB